MRDSSTPTIVMLAGGGVTHLSGGVGTLITYLVDSWSATPGAPRIIVMDTRGAGSKWAAIRYFLSSLLGLVWRAMRGQVDLVHAHMTTRGSALRKCLLSTIAFWFGIPVVMHMHGADFAEFYHALGPTARGLIRAVLRRCDAVVVLGNAWRDFLIAELGIDPQRVLVIPNGVPQPAAQDRPADADRPVEIVFLGRLGDRKGVPELLAALATPELQARPWHATLAGDGEIERFRDAACQAGLAQRTTIPGWLDRSQTISVLARADLLVLPSHHEGMPIAIIEALAWGVPVVTTPVGAIGEYLTDGETARLVPPGDVTALAAALASLIDDPAERARLGQAGNAVFEDRLEIGCVAQRFAALYRDLVSRKAIDDARIRGLSAVYSVIDRMQIVHTDEEAAALLDRLGQATRPTVVSFVNQHAINLAWSKPGFAHILTASDILLRDGVGAELSLAALGRAPGKNMNGTDFIPRMMDYWRGRRVALYGTAEPWIGYAAQKLRHQGHRIVSTRHGFLPDQDYVAAAIGDAPDLIILAMGLPKQERVANELARALPYPAIIVNGGGVVDFIAGRFARAPRWMQSLRLEWVFRLIQEPRRLSRRYGPGGVLFAYRIARLGLALRGKQPNVETIGSD